MKIVNDAEPIKPIVDIDASKEFSIKRTTKGFHTNEFVIHIRRVPMLPSMKFGYNSRIKG